MSLVFSGRGYRSKNIQRPWMLIFVSLWVLCHIFTIWLWANLLTFLGYTHLSENLYSASASFTHIVTLWYRIIGCSSHIWDLWVKIAICKWKLGLLIRLNWWESIPWEHWKSYTGSDTCLGHVSGMSQAPGVPQEDISILFNLFLSVFPIHRNSLWH